MSVAARHMTGPETVDQVARELYGMPASQVNAAKGEDWRRYLRTGRGEMARALVLTPAQLRAALDGGMGVREIRATMIEANDTLGGYLVPENFADAVLRRTRGLTAITSRARVLQAIGDTLPVPVVQVGGDSAGRFSSTARVAWIHETGTTTEAASDVRFGLQRIPVGTAMCALDLSRNLWEDAADVELLLVDLLAEAHAVSEDDKAMTGEGLGGSPRGILPGSANGAGITEVVSGTASALTSDGLSDLVLTVPAQYRRSGRCAWLMSTSTLKLVADLKDGSGRPVVSWESRADRNGVPVLMGFPVEEVSAPEIAANAYPVVFGDLSAYTIADRVGMSVEVFASDATVMKSNAVSVISRRRMGGQLTHPERLAVQKISA